MRIEPDQLNQLLRPVFSATDRDQAVKDGKVLARGLPAGPARPPVASSSSAADAVAWAEPASRSCWCATHEPRRHSRYGRRSGHPHRPGRMTSHAALVAPRWQGLHRGCSEPTSTCRPARSRSDGTVVKR